VILSTEEDRKRSHSWHMTHQGLLHAQVRPTSDRVWACVRGPSRMGAALREEGPSEATTPGTGSYLATCSVSAVAAVTGYWLFRQCGYLISHCLSTVAITDC
jgi:hypothetical protein